MVYPEECPMYISEENRFYCCWMECSKMPASSSCFTELSKSSASLSIFCLVLSSIRSKVLKSLTILNKLCIFCSILSGFVHARIWGPGDLEILRVKEHQEMPIPQTHKYTWPYVWALTHTHHCPLNSCFSVLCLLKEHLGKC